MKAQIEPIERKLNSFCDIDISKQAKTSNATVTHYLSGKSPGQRLYLISFDYDMYEMGEYYYSE